MIRLLGTSDEGSDIGGIYAIADWLPAMYKRPLFGVQTACVYHAADGGIR